VRIASAYLGEFPEQVDEIFEMIADDLALLLILDDHYEELNDSLEDDENVH